MSKRTMMPVYVKKILLLVVLILASLVLVAQQDISVLLRINNKEKLIVYHDEPLMISVSFSNPLAAANEQWNRQAAIGISQLEEKKRSETITEEQYNNEKLQLEANKKKVSTYTIGSAASPVWKMIQFSWIGAGKQAIPFVPVKLLYSEHAPAELVLDANAYYVLQWGVDRQTMQDLKPGKYLLQVMVDGYRSQTVAIEVRSTKIPATVLNTEAMQEALGRFALLYEKTDEVMAHGKKLLSLNPSSINGLILLGEGYALQHNYLLALRNFESALKNFNKQFPHSPEPPSYILEMIDWLKEKSAQ